MVWVRTGHVGLGEGRVRVARDDVVVSARELRHCQEDIRASPHRHSQRHQVPVALHHQHPPSSPNFSYSNTEIHSSTIPIPEPPSFANLLIQVTSQSITVKLEATPEFERPDDV